MSNVFEDFASSFVPLLGHRVTITQWGPTYSSTDALQNPIERQDIIGQWSGRVVLVRKSNSLLNGMHEIHFENSITPCYLDTDQLDTCDIQVEL